MEDVLFFYELKVDVLGTILYYEGQKIFLFLKGMGVVGVVITWDSNATTTIIVTALEATRPMNRIFESRSFSR
jgi:hypothetical protein